MRYLRGFLIAATLIAVVVSPVLFANAASVMSASSAYAAVATSNANEDNENNNNNNNSNGNDNGDSNSNGNGNGNGNGNSNGNGNGNDNVECFPNLNSNDNVPCNFNGNGNGNDNGVGFPGGGGSRVGNSVTGTTKCFDVQEVGLVQRSLDNADVTLAVPPDAGFSAVTRLTLHGLDPSSVPAPTGGATLPGGVVFTIDAQAGCDGPAIVSLPGGVNLGITYRASADKSKLQIMSLQGGTWENVTTVPDSVNPYVSASITNAGTYALVQKP
jgi:hypothetical protein